MNKPTLIFDFDSTLVNIETLEVVLKNNCNASELKEIESLTIAGMEGSMPFSESLQKRLAIAKPTLKQLTSFVNEADTVLTDHALETLNELHKDFDIWIISGGFRELIHPFAKYLGIKENQVLAVSALWSQDGSFQSLDSSNPFCDGKVQGAKAYQAQWTAPVTIVGDGATDYALFEQGIADQFIAYTEHAQRAFLEKIDSPQVHNMRQLLEILSISF